MLFFKCYKNMLIMNITLKERYIYFFEGFDIGNFNTILTILKCQSLNIFKYYLL